jgi:RNA polymerase primary sigma factor
MYLKEMGSVELLSREGEISIAKRIEAGRELMIGGIYETPLAMRSILKWRDEVDDGTMLLRDIIDLETTYARINGGANEPVTPREDEEKNKLSDIKPKSELDNFDSKKPTVESDENRLGKTVIEDNNDNDDDDDDNDNDNDNGNDNDSDNDNDNDNDYNNDYNDNDHDNNDNDDNDDNNDNNDNDNDNDNEPAGIWRFPSES